MKKLFLLTMACMMAVFAMAVPGDGQTSANAIEFNWETGNDHPGGSLWYRVSLDKLDEVEHPALNLYLANLEDVSVDVSVYAKVATEELERSYTILPHQIKSWSANASLLKQGQQEALIVNLTSNGKVHMSAKVFESTSLDDACKQAQSLKWNEVNQQKASISSWWKVDLTPIKSVSGKDAKITIKNVGKKTMNLKVGQSFDCPSSGLSKREFQLAAGQSISDTVPEDVIKRVVMDEVYIAFVNSQPIEILVEPIDKPTEPIFSACEEEVTELPLDGGEVIIKQGKHLYRLDVAKANAEQKLEPEYSFRNETGNDVAMSVGIIFGQGATPVCPIYSASTSHYVVTADGEVIVFKKNMLDGIDDVDFIYLLIDAEKQLKCIGGFKNVNAGLDCKNNIDFNWEFGNKQDAYTVQWYAVDLSQAKADKKDITVEVFNLGDEKAQVNAELAFSCPSYDTQKFGRPIAAGKSLKHKFQLSTYQFFGDIAYVGLSVTQDVIIKATLSDAEPNFTPEPEACGDAELFSLKDGGHVDANQVKWFKVAMKDAELIEVNKHPVLFIQNYGDKAAKVHADIVESCTADQATSGNVSVPAMGTYTHDVSLDLIRSFKANISEEAVYVYVRVTSTENIDFELRLTEKPAGSDCASAIPFNWTSGTHHPAGKNLWYAVDISTAKETKSDILLTVTNKANAKCEGTVWVAYDCPVEAPEVVPFKLDANQTKGPKRIPYSAFALLKDVIYVRVISNTALYAKAELVDAETLAEDIDCSTLEITDFAFDQQFDVPAEGRWFQVPAEMIAQLRENKDFTIKASVTNGRAAQTINLDAAFECPIHFKPVHYSKPFKAGETKNKVLKRSTVEEYLSKDFALIHLTGSKNGTFSFILTLVEWKNGNDPFSAIDVNLENEIRQEANTVMWYHINTADLKADNSLHGKGVKLSAKNHGGKANIKVEVYDDQLAEKDLLRGRAKRTVSAGKSYSHNAPAYAIYGVADVELWIKVTTDQPISASSKLYNYRALAESEYENTKENAKLAVPNVDYYIEANTPTWFAGCVPYLRNNFEMHEKNPDKGGKTTATFYNLNENEAAEITVTGTWQDVLTYKIPERSRTIAAGKHCENKDVREIAYRAINKTRFSEYADLAKTTKLSLIDSLLREYLTSDSLTAYVRVTSTQPLRLRLNTPQTTGYDCQKNPMDFDWEHGNVSEAGRENWIHVKLSPERVPVGKDLLLHMDNWSENPTTIEASLYQEDCEGEALGSIRSKQIQNDTTKRITRNVIESKWGWSGVMLNYKSSETTHIWAELVDNEPQDTTIYMDTAYVCPDEKYEDKYTIKAGETHIIKADDPSTWTWTTDIDSINKEDLTDTTFHFVYHVFPKQMPKVIAIDDLTAKPVIARGQVLDIDALKAELYSTLEANRTGDSIMYVAESDIIWEYTPDGSTWLPIPTTPLTSVNIALRYRYTTTECGKDYTSERTANRPVDDDTLKVYDACKEYDWEGVVRTEDGLYSVEYRAAAIQKPNDSIAFLDLKLLSPVEANVGGDEYSDCESYEWLRPSDQQKFTFVKDTLVSDTLSGAAHNGCDSITNYQITIRHIVRDTLRVTHCNWWQWKASEGGNDEYYRHSTVDPLPFVTIPQGAANGCDSISYLALTLTNEIEVNLEASDKYGHRLLMINRNAIMEKTGWDLDSLGTEGVQVVWYRYDDENDDTEEVVGTGYYLTNKENPGEPMPEGLYMASIVIPAEEEGGCPKKGETKLLDCRRNTPAPMAPMLVPSVARPGEMISVINLDPETETVIRVYTSEGFRLGAYNVSGEETFQINAAAEHGLYLVELSNDSLKTTLRYIVK